jgi:hypothetical protein
MGMDEKYPYKFRIEIPRDNMNLLDDVKDWAESLNLPCILIPGVAYVRTKEDATMFVLRWS